MLRKQKILFQNVEFWLEATEGYRILIEKLWKNRIDFMKNTECSVLKIRESSKEGIDFNPDQQGTP